MNEVGKLLNKQLEHGKIDGGKLASTIAVIQPTLDYAGFEHAEIVFKAVV